MAGSQVKATLAFEQHTPFFSHGGDVLRECGTNSVQCQPTYPFTSFKGLGGTRYSTGKKLL